MQNEEKKKDQLLEQDIDLKEVFFIIHKKKWILVTITCIIMVLDLIYTFKQTPMYRATSLVLIEKPTSQLSQAVSQEQVIPTIGALDYYNTQYEILQSRTLAKRVCKILGLEKLEEFDNEHPEVAFLELIYINPVKDTRLVEVSVDYKDPEMAARMANTLASLYIEQNIENLLFMSKEILKSFPEEAGELEKHTVYGQLKDMSKEEMMESLPSIINNPVLQKLKSEKVTIETEKANLIKRYKKAHPQMIAIDNKLMFIDEQINAEVSRTLRSVRADLAGTLQANNIRVVDYAEVPEKPIRPNIPLNILLGLFASVFFGGGIIFLTEYLDDSIKNEEDVEKKTGLPFLGHFPILKTTLPHKFSDHVFGDIDKNEIDACEAIKALRTNILFSMSGSNTKNMLITSTVPQEGKSLLSAYLAYSFAQNGEKTLLIEADLRKPSVHRMFNLERKPGLTNIIIENLESKNVVKKTTYDNLYVLTAGTSTPNAVELLGSVKMKKLLEKLSSEFEKIIIDSPPSLVLSDSLALSKFVDGVVIAVKAGYISADAVNKLKGKFIASGGKIIGIALNFFEVTQHATYYHHKYYRRYYKDGYPKNEHE